MRLFRRSKPPAIDLTVTIGRGIVLPPVPGENISHVTLTTRPYDWKRDEPDTPQP